MIVELELSCKFIGINMYLYTDLYVIFTAGWGKCYVSLCNEYHDGGWEYEIEQLCMFINPNMYVYDC